MSKEIIVIYDENDIVDNKGIGNFIDKYLKLISGAGVEDTKMLESSDNEGKEDVFSISYKSCIIKFVHESLWEYDYDDAEKKYGETNNRKIVALTNDLQTFKEKVEEKINNL